MSPPTAKTRDIIELDIKQRPDILTAQQGCEADDFRETKVVRWQSIDCSATEFQTKGYRMRANLYSRRRTTKLLISVAITPSHSAEDVRKTISTIVLSINDLNNTKILSLSSLGWKDIVVLLVGSVDEMKSDVVDLLQQIGIYITEQLDHYSHGLTAQTFESTILLSPGATTTSEKPSPSPSPCQLAFLTSHTSLTPEEANKWILYGLARPLNTEIWISLQAHQTASAISETTLTQVLNEFYLNERYLSITIKDYKSPGGMITAQALSPFASRDGLVHLDMKAAVMKEALQAGEDKVCAYRLTLDLLPESLTFE